MSKVLKFLREVRVEFKNITWPKRDTLIQLTVVVISISVFISLILGGFDYIFTNSIALLGNLKTVSPTTAPVPIITASPTISIVTPTKIIKKK